MISVKQASEIILKNILPLNDTETLNINCALGRVCASDIRAKENIPPFNNSAMDGFAIIAKDSAGASREKPEILEVIADLPAGYSAGKSVGHGQAIRIMTGAMLPKGADSVLMVEDSENKNKQYVKIFRQVERGENVRYCAEDVRRGERVVKKSDILKSGYIGMLASLGISRIKVFRKPKVAILATGDELVEINQRLSPGKIRNSNAYSLSAQVSKAGAIPVSLGIAGDRRDNLERKLKKGLSADMVLVSGGISVGDYDLVKDALRDLGAEFKFWRVAMKPGKPLAFGLMNKMPVFGLPGNPVSSMISFEQFARPALLKMAGAADIFRFRFPAIFKENFRKKKGLRYFLRVALENKNGKLYASLTGPQGSGILKSMVLANAIMELPEGASEIHKGESAQVTYLD